MSHSNAQALPIPISPKTGKPVDTSNSRYKYNPVLAKKIISLVANGITLKEATEQFRDQNGPAYETMFDWLCTYPELEHRYARARLQYYEAFAQETIRIADGANDKDWKGRRLQVETRQWILERANPDHWGPKLKADIRQSIAVTPVINIVLKGKLKVGENFGSSEVSTIDITNSQGSMPALSPPVKRKGGRPKGSPNKHKRIR